MNPLNGAYNENFLRGSLDFPFDYHYINHNHPRFVMPFHYHIDFELLRVIKGTLTINLNERNYVLHSGEYLLIAPGLVHGGKPSSSDDVYECVVFNLSQLFDLNRPENIWLKRITNREVMLFEHFSPQNHQNLCKMGDVFFNAVEPSKRKSQLTAFGALLEFIGFMIDCKFYITPHQRLSSRYLKHLNKSSDIFRYIFDNYTKDISLEDLADTAGMTPKYFCRYFKELTECRPIEYLNRFRIEAAALKLSTDGENINQIAYICGFKNPCYFTKLFKRYKNLSPSEYRHKALEKSLER